MPKIKMPRHSPQLDMTPMVDLAFLLVTFFILSATFRDPEPVTVTTPSSVDEKIIPENIMLFTVDPSGKVFYNLSGAEARKKTLQRMGQKYKITFTAKEIDEFAKMSSIGVSMQNLKTYINMDAAQRNSFPHTGVPLDSTNNQLRDWIIYGRTESVTATIREKEKTEARGLEFKGEKVRYALKADGQANYIVVNEVIKNLVKLDITRVNLITNLEKGE